MTRSILGLLLVALFPGVSVAQVPTSEEVVFFTTDQVELVGTYYQGSKGSRSPCVLLLHELKGSRRDKGWRELALALQKKGDTVLAFDFRGHGESTTVQKDFWTIPAHHGLKGASIDRSEISFKDYTQPVLFATLVNDIAAARHFLDLKSRAGLCDSTNIVVVGADTGAALGALWIATEWQRWRTARDAQGKFIKQGLEGHDIACAVWLSINPNGFGRQPLPLESWFHGTVQERVPMVFLYGEDDARDANISKRLKEKFQLPNREMPHNLTGFSPVKDTALGGSELLNLGTPTVREAVVNYIENVLRQRRRVTRSGANLDVIPPLIQPDRFGVR